MQTRLLNGQWRFKELQGKSWHQGSVPGSVYADLLAAGQMKDPFYRDNEDDIRGLSSKNYVYERHFNVDQLLLESDSLQLIFEGIDTLSKIYLNDTFLAETDNMHRTYKFEVKDLLASGENHLRLELFSPLEYITEKQKGTWIWGVEDAVEGFPHLRKAHSMFGWDWGPQLPDAGIWRDVYLRADSAGAFEDVSFSQHHTAENVELTVHTIAKLWHENDIAIRGVITSPDGENIAEKTKETNGAAAWLSLSIQNPQKWYPASYGEQPLYHVTVQLLCENSIVDEQTYKIGLRTIEVVQENDEWGESFYFKVNGVPVFAKGANYIPEDNILSRVTPEKTEALIKDCVDANFNMIRVWGGGHYPSNLFYELCDQYGLIVWQDFMFACAVYDLNNQFAATVREEIKDNVKRLRHHASLGIWCGNNEMEYAWTAWGFPKTEKHRQDYLDLFESLIPSVLQETDPITFYWPSSPSSGGGFKKPNDEHEGDVHYWDVWHGLKPFTEYRQFHFRFVSEFGFQSFPALKTVESFTKEEDRNIFSYVMEKHQKNGDANGKILYYLAENFKYPKDFDSLLYASQLLQAEAIKYGVEHWRRHTGRCMGAIYWQLNDCWPVASWASIDYYGRWKALHYFAKRFFSMVLISAEEAENKAEIVVTNDYSNHLKGQVAWVLRAADSSVVEKGMESVEIGPVTAEKVLSLDFSNMLRTYDDRRSHYLEFVLESNSGNSLSSGTTLFVPAKHFKFSNPNLRFTVEEQEESFAVLISGSAFAKYVELSHDSDILFSDNYMDLHDSEEPIKVTVNKDKLEENMSLKEFKDGLSVRSLYDTFT